MRFTDLFVRRPVLAIVVNLVVLTSAASSANSGVYSTSRMIYGLATNGNAPARFGRLSRNKVPQNALMFSCVFMLFAVVMLYAGDSVMGAFVIVTSVASVIIIFTWSMIMVSTWSSGPPGTSLVIMNTRMVIPSSVGGSSSRRRRK